MTIADLRCDVCGRFLPGPSERGADPGAVRLLMHPGDGLLKDDSTMLCPGCWSALEVEVGSGGPDECARCAVPVAADESLHLAPISGAPELQRSWQLCRAHAVEFLNRLRTTDPKLTVDTLRLRRDFHGGRSVRGAGKEGTPPAPEPRPGPHP